MARIDSAQIAGVMGRLLDDRIVSHINRATLILQLLEVLATRGSAIEWGNKFGNPAGSGALAEGADVTEFNTDQKVPAKLDHGIYSEAFRVTGYALSKALASGNPDDLVALFMEEMQDAIERLAKSIAIDFYIGNGVHPKMHGIYASPGALGATGVYAGIDRTIYPQWAATVLGNGGTGRALTLALMREAVQRIYEACGAHPDFLLASPSVYTKYGNLLGEHRRYLQEVTISGQRIVLDGGFRALEFDGLPVFQDVDMPAVSATRHRMGFMNSSVIRLEYSPHASAEVMGHRGERDIAGGEEYQKGPGQARGLRARINPLAVEGDEYPFQLIVYPQVRVKRPNKFATIEDINPAL
jgi:hypothetical protein